MKDVQASQKRDRKYRLILFLVIGLTAFSSAMKEWRQVLSMTQEVAEFVSTFSGAMVPTANARTPSHAISSIESMYQKSDEFRWNGTIGAGQSIEIKGINGDITAEAASGNQVEVVALKKSRRSDVSSVQIKVVEHPGGVTICAIYPNEGGSNSCEPGDVPRQNNDVRVNDVSVEFMVRVPQGVGFIGRTINGDISATSLSSNVVSKTINGSITISTTGYAEAKTINGGISAKLGNTNWSGAIEFSTLNGEITLDLPANLNTDIEAKTLNGSIHSDFPLNVESIKDRKHVKAKIGSGGRELQLKTLNGSINLRTT